MTRSGLIMVCALLHYVVATADAMAATRLIPTQLGALASAIRDASPGDVLRLAPGHHAGGVTIDRPLTLDGAGKAKVIGPGVGSVITVTAADVTISGLIVSGSGSSAEHRDAGIALTQKAARARVIDNRLLGNLIGVDIHGAHAAVVSRNTIQGRRDHRMNSRGNGVYVWNAPGARVEDNDIRWGRDGIFVNTSRKNTFIRNRFRDLRFAIHYMYAHDSEVSGNLSIGNHLGYAVMFSRNVTVRDNVSEGDRDYGVMLNYTNSSRIEGNRVTATGDRCAFIYNAHKNTIENNRFEECGIGIHFTAGSERNTMTGNAFINNRTQVKYVGSRWVDWSTGGRGNYWSDHAAYDLNGDGIAEGVYRPNGTIDHVLWSQPAARLLLGSPAIHLIRWSQSNFPALLPGGVVDRHPLMRPPPSPRVVWDTRQ